jgi:hypothetical protein
VKFYHDISAPVWAICMMLFGIYFPQRWRFDRSFPWIKWAIGAPLLAIAFVARGYQRAGFDGLSGGRAIFPETPSG